MASRVGNTVSTTKIEFSLGSSTASTSLKFCFCSPSQFFKMNSKVLLCLSRACNLKSRTVNHANIMNIHRTNYLVNKSRLLCTQSACKGVYDRNDGEESEEIVNFTIVHENGERIDVSEKVGETVWKAARDQNIIQACCEGRSECGACHMHIDERTANVLEKPIEREKDTLDGVAYLQNNSRLCCQLKISKEFEGVTFKIPNGTTHMNVDKS